VSFLSIIPAWVWALALAGAAATSCTQTIRLEREQSKHAQTKTAFAEYRAELESKRAEASEESRQKEQELSHAATQAQAQADALRGQLDRDRAGARVAAQRLRDAVATAALVADSQCQGATAAAVGQTRATAARVLADVLAEADDIAGRVAEGLDRSRAAGLTCERLYEEVRRVLNH
jgi:vacuolar-type H+-ATPase subunit I/STV1